MFLSPGSRARTRAILRPITNSLTANVSLTNVALFFDGPTVAQGSRGLFFASGSVTIQDTTGGAGFDVKLWDGTTVIDAADINTSAATFGSVALSGYILNPTGNIRMSVRDLTTTTGLIIFNRTGTSRDSTVTAFRIIG